MPSYPIRPTFPIDVRSTPSIKATREGMALRFDLVPAVETPVFDVDYQALATDTLVGFRTLTAPRTLWLPKAAAYPIGQVFFGADLSGQCSVDRSITIAVSPGSGDTIAGQTAIQVTDAYQGLGFRRGAANVWIIVR